MPFKNKEEVRGRYAMISSIGVEWYCCRCVRNDFWCLWYGHFLWYRRSFVLHTIKEYPKSTRRCHRHRTLQYLLFAQATHTSTSRSKVRSRSRILAPIQSQQRNQYCYCVQISTFRSKTFVREADHAQHCRLLMQQRWMYKLGCERRSVR